MVAAGHLEITLAVGKLALFYILDPGAVDAERHFILRLAGGATGVATDAGLIIYNEAIVHSFLLE
jgi:hypothetical protein